MKETVVHTMSVEHEGNSSSYHECGIDMMATVVHTMSVAQI